MKRFEQIYKAINNSPGISVTDMSFWRYPRCAQTSITIDNPLHIILEDNANKKRIWIFKFGREYSIAVANMLYPSGTAEYHSSQKRYVFSTQKDVVRTLEEILKTENNELFNKKAA